MLEARRKAYLEAMGIELWQGKGRQPAALLPLQGSESATPTPTPNASPPNASPPNASPPNASPPNASPPNASPPNASPSGVATSQLVPAPAARQFSEQPPAFEQIPADAYEEPPYLDDEDVDDHDLPPPVPGVTQLDWPALQERVQECRSCSLCESRSNTVFGVGDRQARLMVIGEAPGADEDKAGEPFVGRAGQLLTEMLKAIGLQRSQVYIANVLKCRPPSNRDPQVDEVAACQPYLNRQIALIQPDLILSVGGVSAKNLLGTDESVGRLRGRVHRYPATDTPLMVTYHPAYLLRKPSEKAKAWQDLQSVHRYLHREQSA